MLRTACTTAFLVLFVVGQSALATSNKYARPSSGSSSSDDSSNSDSNSAPTTSGKKASTTQGGAQAPATQAPGAQGANPNGKVDLTDLENRYWTAKDTEFNVVQNRLYTKAKRFALNFMLGADLSSQYTNDYNGGLALSYYFSEREGVTLQLWKTWASNASFTNAINPYGAAYNYNFPQGYVGVNYNWVPIYAKISLLEKKILYFDMSVNPGLGATLLSSNSFGTTQNPVSPVSQTAITAALDISQQVFLSSHWAIKLDIDNHFYPESVYAAATNPGAGTTANGVVQNKFTYSAIFMLGVTFFQ